MLKGMATVEMLAVIFHLNFRMHTARPVAVNVLLLGAGLFIALMVAGLSLS